MADNTHPSERRRSSIQGIKDKLKKFVHGEKQPSPEDERPHDQGLQGLGNNNNNNYGDGNNKAENVVGREDKGLGGADRLVSGDGDGRTSDGVKVGQTGLSGSNY